MGAKSNRALRAGSGSPLPVGDKSEPLTVENARHFKFCFRQKLKSL